MVDIKIWQWGLVIASSLVLFFISPLAKNTNQFFNYQSYLDQQSEKFGIDLEIGDNLSVLLRKKIE